MNIYVDSSVVVAALLEEPRHEEFRCLLSQAGSVLSSYLLEAEVFAAAAREQISLDETQEQIRNIVFIAVNRKLVEEYKKIFSIGYSKGADALHLATALFIDPTAKNLVFLTADTNQKSIAQKLGFRVE